MQRNTRVQNEGKRQKFICWYNTVTFRNTNLIDFTMLNLAWRLCYCWQPNSETGSVKQTARRYVA